MAKIRAIVKHDPLSIKYIKILRIFLWTVGHWPGEILGEDVPLFVTFMSYSCLPQAILIFIGQLNYLYKFSKTVTFYILGHCIFTTLLPIVLMMRNTLPYMNQYGKLIHQYLFSFHLMNFKHKGVYYNQVHQFIEQVSYYFTLFMSAMMVSATILFNLPPLYNNYKIGAFIGSREPNSTFQFTVYYIYPFFNPVEHFKLATIFNVYVSFVCSCLICMIDLLMSLMVFQIVGHIKILRHNLSNFPRPRNDVVIDDLVTSTDASIMALETYDVEENQMVHKQLSECIDHHRLILAFTNDLSSLFGPIIFVNHTFHLAGCCFLLFLCTRDAEAALTFGPVTVIIFGQLFLMSITFEVLGVESEKLADDVYEMPWDCMNKKNRRVVWFMLTRAQTPIRVTAMGLITVGVTTMAKILKTTFTYFTLLQSMDQ